jgi:threonine dehydratase
MSNLNFSDVVKTHNLIKNYIKKTAVVFDKNLNEELQTEIFFKLENLQETQSFKARGAFSAVLNYQEKHQKLPEKIVAQSSGNHAQAIASVGKKLGIPVLIYMAKNVSPLKVAKARELGAEVILCEKRIEANLLAEAKVHEGYFFIHPSANEEVILGQATATLEALDEIGEVDAIFAPCGGGGLISGCYLAALGQKNKPKIFACEPLNANDAAISIRQNKIFHFDDSPNSIADGARTLGVAEPCFTYLKKLDGILEIEEEEIIFWQKKLSEILEMKIEPTSALGIAGAARFAKENKNSKLLVIISGGNL